MQKELKQYIHAKLFVSGKWIEDGSLLVDRCGVIREIISSSEPFLRDVEIIDLQGRFVIPGFIDVHIHGGAGYDVMDGELESLRKISLFHGLQGTTSFLATTRTEKHEEIIRALEVAADAVANGIMPGADLVGIHLEGPFIDEKRRGAQQLEYIQIPNKQTMEAYTHAAGGHIRLVTLAPEVDGGMEAVRWYKDNGVTVSIGHSDASFEQVVDAVASGAAHTTHHFNGMRPLHHREPGIAGAGLILDGLTTELIADGFHVHPAIVRLLYRVKGSHKICVITDCSHCAGLPDGVYGGVKTINGEVRLLDGNSLAGSTLTTFQGFINVMKYTGFSMEEVLPSFTEVPARQAGISASKGSLSPGKDADFLVVNSELKLEATYVKGRKVSGKTE